MKNRPMRLYLLDMQTAIQRILSYTEGLDYDGFSTNFMVVDAVIRNFEVLGEASKNISSEIREEYPKVPWKKMYALRNMVIHEYFGIDHILIWDIVKNYLPENLEDLNKVIEEVKD